MIPEERAAIINARVACALIDMEAMKAANTERESHGLALAYNEEAFHALINTHQIGNSRVLETLGFLRS